MGGKKNIGFTSNYLDLCFMVMLLSSKYKVFRLQNEVRNMEKTCFHMNMSRCIGCGACQVACKEKNRLPDDVFFRRAGIFSFDSDGRKVYYRYSGACNNCDEPACVQVCPVSALYKDDDGQVVHRDDRCIGCGRCVYACPYNAPVISPLTGLSSKCDACGGDPECVKACPVRALEYSPVASDRSFDSPLFLPDIRETGPSLYVYNIPEKLSAKNSDTPVCNVSDDKADKASPKAVQSGLRFVVLGGGIAAAEAAKVIREHDISAQITLISNEKASPYSRPMLSKSLIRGFDVKRYQTDLSEFESRGITVKLGTAAKAIHTAEKVVDLNNGEKIHYDRLIYAVGAEPVMLNIPGKDRKEVFTVRTVEDVNALHAVLPSAGAAAVIGGGAIGLETAWQLKKYGLNVTVIDIAPGLFENRTGHKLSEMLNKKLQAAGIAVLTSTKALEFAGDEHLSVVRTDKGDIPAEIAIVSAGIRPNVAIAQQAGLTVSRGVVVDDLMRTSDPSIFACGDCTEHQGRIDATCYRALVQAKKAACSALGIEDKTSEKPDPLVLHTAGTALFAIGKIPDQSGENAEDSLIFVSNEDGFKVNPRMDTECCVSLYFTDGKLVAASLLGDLGPSAILEKAVIGQWRKEDLIKALSERGTVK